MSVVKQVDQDMIAAMKAKDAERLLTIRMMKTAFKNKDGNLLDRQALATVALIDRPSEAIIWGDLKCQLHKRNRLNCCRGSIA